MGYYWKIGCLLCVISVFNVYGHISDEEYALMPPIFHLDEYDRCLHLGDKSLYCTVSLQLEPLDPDNPSRVWNIIQQLINNKKNYRHDRLRHGICVVHSCPNLARNITFYKEDQNMLKSEITKCYNRKYRKMDLKNTVTEINCKTAVKDNTTLDVYDVLVALLLLAIIAAAIAGTFYEGCARYKPKEEYDKLMSIQVGKILECFSLRKNWSRLRTISDAPDAIALRPINAVRFYNMLLVIMAHTCMIAYGGPILNPQFFERITDNPLNMLMINGGFSIQSYFIMAGWLLCYQFFVTFEGKKDVRWFSYIILAFINRYIRLTPSLFIAIAISATWLHKFGDGPFWEKLVGSEYNNCRTNWWSNMLYINNYYDSKHMCIQQSWYLAADTQLFLLSLFIVILMWKYQQHIKIILGVSFSIALLIPGIINYVWDYDITVRQYPEELYNTLLDNKEWHRTYIPAYVNIGGYVIGLTFGYIFYKYRSQKFLQTKIQITVWWILTWSLPLSMIFLGVFMYRDDYQHSTIISALYAAFGKNLYALGVAIGIYGASEGTGWFFRDAMHWLPVQVLGRLSYCAFLIHVIPIRARGGLIRAPLYVTPYVLLTHAYSDISVSYLMALALCLLVEMPISALQKLFVPQMQKKETESSDIRKKLK